VEKHYSKQGKNEMSESSLSEIKDDDISEAVERARTKPYESLEWTSF